MTAARDELTAAWATWQTATLYKSWAAANPAEAKKLAAYRAGGPRPTMTTATGKALVYETAAWLALAPPVPPPSTPLGALVGSPPPPLTGTVLRVATTRELIDAVAAIARAPQGQVVELGGASLDLAGGTLQLPAISVRSEIRNGRVFGGGGNSNVRADGSASKWTIRDIASDMSKADGFKITDSAADIWLVDTSASGNLGMGYLTTGNPRRWQMWNPRAAGNGKTGDTLVHNWYIGSMSDGCLLANFEGRDPSGYNLQVQYPEVTGGIITCGTLVGGSRSLRGGTVLSYGSSKAKLVGIVTRDAAYPAVAVYNGSPYPAVSGMEVFDSYEERTGGFEPSGGVTYTNCHAGAAGPVDAARYGYVPALDIDGNPRPAAPRAGCYA